MGAAADCVHGGEAGGARKQAHLGHLGEARDFARCIVVWMLHYLVHLARTVPPGGGTPLSRKDLLTLIDPKSKSIGYAATILQSLPTFPYVREWLG